LANEELASVMKIRSSRYKPEAYIFILKAMRYAHTRPGRRGHLTGQEFARVIAEFVRSLYGPLAKNVLEDWGIRETLDFGRIVYDLIDVGQMSKLPEDSLDDFRDVYAFDEEFGDGYDWAEAVLDCLKPKES